MIRGVAARLIDAGLRAQGRLLPYYPGEWRAVELFRRHFPEYQPPLRRITRRGVRYELQPGGIHEWMVYYVGEDEAWETRAVRSIVRPGWNVVDVGANIGYYTLLFSRCVGASGRVDAFEPAPHTCNILRHHLRLNRADNVSVHQIALADGAGRGGLIDVPSLDRAQTRLARSDEASSVPIDVGSLDGVMAARAEPVDFIKVDIEGMEPAFLRGAADTIARFAPTILIEFNPPKLATFASSTTALAEQLTNLGYDLYLPARRGLVPWAANTVPGLYWNVIAVPRHRGDAR